MHVDQNYDFRSKITVIWTWHWSGKLRMKRHAVYVCRDVGSFPNFKIQYLRLKTLSIEAVFETSSLRRTFLNRIFCWKRSIQKDSQTMRFPCVLLLFATLNICVWCFIDEMTFWRIVKTKKPFGVILFLNTDRMPYLRTGFQYVVTVVRFNK